MIDLLDRPEERAFRAEVTGFVEANLPAETRARVRHGAPVSADEIRDWHRRLHARGWAAPAWPTEHGGPGWSTRMRLVFEEAMFRAHAPPIPAFGVRMIGPVLMRFGTPTQKAHFLPRILDGRDWWCQGFSEPGAGSDLASLRTRGIRVEGGWRIDGGKTWTTLAQHADWMFCLVRTDPGVKKQLGISMMLVDMSDPGVTVQPIRLLDGSEEVNAVFLDGVFVPDAQVVGEPGAGWGYAKFLLGHERYGIGGVGRSKHLLERARALAERAGLDADARIADELAAIEIDVLAVEATTLRLLAAEEAGLTVGAEPSLLKVRGTEIQQRLTELMLEIAGPRALPVTGDGIPLPDVAEAFWHVASQHLNWRKLTIYGGSNEIQRGILARQVLGL